MCPHPEVTLDTFGFAVGAHLAARWAVFGLLLAKVGLFGDQKPVFAPKIQFFIGAIQTFWSYHDGGPTGQLFGTDHVAQRAPRGALEPIFSPKICFFYATPI